MQFKFVVIAAIIAVAGILVFALSYNEGESKNLTPTSTISLQEIFATSSPIRGDSSAPLTIIEFGDYQCINCNRFFHNSEHVILQNYIDTGKAKIIYVDFAFIGPDSLMAAQAAYCAEDQNRYWDYHDHLYSNWNGENTGWANKDNLIRFASELDLDLKAFKSCLEDGKYVDRVNTNISIARKLGVTGTPTFFIIGKGDIIKIVGAQPYSVFEQAINSKL